MECAAAEPPNYNYNGGPVYAGAFNVCPDPGGAIWHSVASHRWWDLSRGGVYAGVTHNSPNLGPTLGAIAVTKGQPKPRFGRIPEAAFLPNGQTDLALVPEYVGVISTIINGKDVVVANGSPLCASTARRAIRSSRCAAASRPSTSTARRS